MYVVQCSSLLLKQFSMSYVRNEIRLASSFKQYESYERFREYHKIIAFWLKKQSGQVAEACARQFEFIAAQRIRRSLQIFHLYTRIWDEVALKEFIKTWRNRTLKNTRHFLMSSIGVTMYNWDHVRISEEELNSYKQEIEGIHRLKDTTVICAKCHLRIVIDAQQPGTEYCKCYGDKFRATSNKDSDGWTPYIERKDMIIWRREEPNYGGLFSYKVYGTFPEVTAEDFFQIQIDSEYRKRWDPTARELKIIDSDLQSQTSTDSTDVVYWETIWPRFFSNRDYVFQRRWVMDKEKQLMIIINKITEHPNAPTKPGIYRVTTYWSYMVIRPYTESHQPGIEFGLTYFEDPGVNVPSTVTTWVASSGLPDFINEMRKASKSYQDYKRTKEDSNIPNTNCIPSIDEDISSLDFENDKIQEEREDLTLDERDIEEYEPDDEIETLILTEMQENDVSDEDIDSTSNSTDEGRGLLRHFFLTKLFV